MKQKNFGYITLVSFVFCLLNFSFTGCGVYKFSDVGGPPPEVKTVKVSFIENLAPYVNPQLSPTLTDRLRQKINNQTKLTLTNSDDAHWIISGYITDYTVNVVGVTSNDGRSQASVNRLNVSVRIVVNKQIEGKEPEEYTASRQFDFNANQTLQAVEASLLDEMVRNLTDEIFNRIFSNW